MEVFVNVSKMDKGMFIIAVFAMCDLHCYMLTFHFLKCHSCIFVFLTSSKYRKLNIFFTLMAIKSCYKVPGSDWYTYQAMTYFLKILHDVFSCQCSMIQHTQKSHCVVCTEDLCLYYTKPASWGVATSRISSYFFFFSHSSLLSVCILLLGISLAYSEVSACKFWTTASKKISWCS